ncbi:gliding motility-associated C-terminal domain-containing protein [Belliella sp. DSM 111904]|uniref:Gliding motility-associated C-terminal domain-containing protein n=1 Tax=Belliella filtrata TaxID=2923435 RepID=A0ABS9V6W3_9BACT|nr:gliding motility-associated C-terminal domain-containing protein [Belliella filtrata]MCH7411685.1 gliding motility-associated C-terminal domain-containing protein [Belliella filtrata]
MIKMKFMTSCMGFRLLIFLLFFMTHIMSGLIFPCQFLSAKGDDSKNQSINQSAVEAVFSPLFLEGSVIEVCAESNEKKGIPNVPIILVPKGGSLESGLITMTDDNGDYFFDDLKVGEYVIKVHDVGLMANTKLYPLQNSQEIFILPAASKACHEFHYTKNEQKMIGGLLWYDLNGDGRPNEWYDANGDGVVTKNVLDGQPISLKEWEWIDFNGDGSYEGAENIGELRMAGIANAENQSNIRIQSPSGVEHLISTDMLGYYAMMVEEEGSYQVSIDIDDYMELEAEHIGNSGKVAVLNDFVLERMISDPTIACGLTTTDQYDFNISPEKLQMLRADFGLRCFEMQAPLELLAIDDELGEFVVSFGGMIGNILDNDLLDGQSVTMDNVDFVFTDLDGIVGLLINPNGELSLIPGVNEARDYRLRYELSEVMNPSNMDEAFVTFRILNDEVDMSVSKTSFGVTIYEGDEFEYEIQVLNQGVTDAENVVITDDLPNGVSYLSSSFQASDVSIQPSTTTNGQRVTWTVPNFPAGASLTIRVQVRANELPSSNPITITNVVTVVSDGEEVSPENNTDTDVNTVNPFFIPNVITPDGDNRNDSFEIKGLGKFATNEIVIFNRYGDHVFERSDYQNDWRADGLPAGTYFYVLRGTDNAGRLHEFKGWIQVIK